jgi:flavin reductase (DIM6/NTAB) family NADH-FMN oxidoreductase RutF
MIYEVDYCGSVTGREIDKFTKCGLKKSYYDSDFVLIDQCKFHLICNVETTIDLGSHDLFVAKVLHKLIDTTVVDIHLDADPIIYFRPNYYQINKNNLGYYGFSKSSVEKLLQ